MEYVASLSYGKDSIVIPELCMKYGLPLNRIVTVDIMATSTLHSELPPMIEFKKKADKIIKERYGIEVEHITAPRSYEEIFYTLHKSGKLAGKINGFPTLKGPWCNSSLKIEQLRVFCKDENITQYLGICADEPERIERLYGTNKIPLPAQLGYTEKMCYELAKSLDLLSPIYENATRGGCWFCHNQSIDQLRFLRKNYPDYWLLMLKWDRASPVVFRPDGHTLHDLDDRFYLEEQGIIPIDKTFRWSMILNNTAVLSTYREEREKKEMINENINTNVTELDKALADKFINKYTLAVENGKKYAWKIAEVIYYTVNHKDFDKAFSSQHEYAVEIGFSDSKISKAISCYEKHLHLIENNQPNFSLGQIEETAKIEIEEMDDFISDTKVNESTTIKEMRKAVKTWISRNNEDVETLEDEEVETVEDINNTILCTFNYEIFSFESSNIEVAEKIKKFIEDNFLNK